MLEKHRAVLSDDHNSTDKLSDPNLSPEIHAVLTRINRNQNTFKPGLHAILERYKEKFHNSYQEETKNMVDMREIAGDIDDE